MANLKTKLLLIILSLSAAHVAFSYVASSSHYLLQSDSVNFGGGFSTSSEFRLQDTLGEAGTVLASSTAILSSGYQAMSVDVYIAVSAAQNASMTPVINGIGGGSSNGSADWVVQTDNPAGYELSIKAAASPALSSGANSFLDYLPSFSEPDFTWTTGQSESRFGYTVEGDNVVDFFKDNGVSCGAGSSNAQDKCWMGFSTTNRTIAQSVAANYPATATTTVKFRAEVGSRKIQERGVYESTVILTAITL